MKINLIGEFDTQYAALKEFVQQFEEATKDTTVKKITINLCSNGGCTYTAFAIYNIIKHSNKHVEIVANSIVASCAVLIFAAGHTRKAYKHTTFMVHEFSSSAGFEEPTSAARKDVKQQIQEQRLYAELLAQNSKLDYKTWTRLMRRVSYFDTTLAVQHGLVHEVL